MRRMFLALFLGGVGLFGAIGTASAGPCDGISNAFAYNECLAKQGPQARTHNPRAGQGADPESTVKERRRGRGRYASGGGTEAGGIAINRRDSGRVSAVIDPWAAIRSGYAPQGKASKRRRR